jgi:threonine/homoserine/homoserine lactone efflux protein
MESQHQIGPLVMMLAAMLGFVFGWLGSIPVAGPIAALVVTRGLEGRLRSGAMLALGAALVEAVYACLAVWGFASLLEDFPWLELVSRGAAALVLAALGVMLWRGVLAVSSDSRDAASDAGSFALGASICALNPTLIATWTGAVTLLHGGGLLALQARHALPFAVGVSLGTTGWFVALLAILHRYRERLSAVVLARTVRLIGAALLVLSGWFAFRFVRYFAAPMPAAASGHAMR